MLLDEALTDYAKTLAQEILLEAETEGAEQMRSEVFTQRLIDTLIDAGELEEAYACSFIARGIAVHGYGIDDEDTLNLVGTIYSGAVPPASVSAGEIKKAAKRLLAFWDQCRKGDYHLTLEDSSDAYDMALAIRQAAPNVRRIRLFVVTDGRSAVHRAEESKHGGVPVKQTVWDISRLHRLETSGQSRESIEVDLTEINGGPLPCLSAGEDVEDYSAFLIAFPGPLLARIYDEFGPRLLELNVRSFLQTRGKVNSGIRRTLADEPRRFLAYNNGISATASSIELVDVAGGGRGIARIKDLQIVNGGQTTASVHAAMKAKIDLEHVFVQAKLTVIDPALVDEIVPLISQFANTQNKVSQVDLRANDPFHVELEKLSRTIWAPASGESLRETRWFYERARGQYADAMGRAGTPARQRAWKTTHPTQQKITKPDIAKYENTWDQRPDLVSRGAQKNFVAYMESVAERRTVLDVAYFERLIAKAIMFKQAEKLIGRQNYGGYRANLVTYSLAKLSLETRQAIDLGRIWTEQGLTPALEEEIVRLSELAWRVLVEQAPVGANITEWAKREACWAKMKTAEWQISPELSGELRKLGRGAGTLAQQTASVGDTKAAEAAVAEVISVGSEAWFAISNWAKESGNLESWQRSLAFSLGKRLAQGKEPTGKQAVQGAKIIAEARRLGFLK